MALKHDFPWSLDGNRECPPCSKEVLALNSLERACANIDDHTICPSSSFRLTQTRAVSRPPAFPTAKVFAGSLNEGYATILLGIEIEQRERRKLRQYSVQECRLPSARWTNHEHHHSPTPTPG